MKYLLPLLLILSACYYGKGQTTQNVGWGSGSISGLIHGDYNFAMGHRALDMMLNGRFNIVVKDDGLLMVQDTSFAFLVDFHNKTLQQYPDVKDFLRFVDYTFRQHPYLRKNVKFQIVIHEYLNRLMEKHQTQLEIIPQGVGKPVPIPPDTNHKGEEVYTADELPKYNEWSWNVNGKSNGHIWFFTSAYAGLGQWKDLEILVTGNNDQWLAYKKFGTWHILHPNETMELMIKYGNFRPLGSMPEKPITSDTLHFSIPVPPGTIGWTKWCDTCSVQYFGFYDRDHISDYPGRTLN